MAGLTVVLFFMPLAGCESPVNGPGPGGEQNGPGEQPQPNPGELGPVVFINAEGWRETLYVTWYKLDGAASYNVYYRKTGTGNWIRIDDPLIREYEGGYFRADVLGISAGTYDVKVVPVNSGGIASANYAIRRNVPVTAHIRTGFAFAGEDHPGAYNLDGTPRDNALIIYITNDNKNTVTVRIQDDPNRWEDAVGLQRILNRFARGHERRPLIVRFVGKITQENFTLQQGTLRMLQLDSGVGGRVNAPITFEGVGNDAVAHGWGIRLNGPSNVEIRNLGFMLGRHNADSIDVDGSRYVWVHHNDFFYNLQGGGDHNKGDGAVDISRSSHVTVSFNHFWDTGKTSLVGTQVGETRGFITYHHNHFDHSDGRHPRVRVHQIHMFNNFFDHVAQHAIGAAGGGPSIFAEANYFRHTRNPMLISRQGTDIAGGGTGTFSGEDGGMIKAYNNFMCEWTLQRFRPWAPENTEQFDAFVVTNRYAPVPDTVISTQGGHTFSNFDLELPYTYTALSPLEARDMVLRYAGRFWGGDISFNFGTPDAEADRSFRNPVLDALLSGYRSRIVAIQGEGSGNGDNENGDNNNGGTGDEPPPPVNGVQTFNFSLAPFDTTTIPDNTIGSLTFGSAFTRQAWNASGGGVTFTHGVNHGGNATGQGAANHAARRLGIALQGPSRITVFATSNSSTASTMHLFNGANDTGVIANAIGSQPIPGWTNGINLGDGITFTSNTEGPHEVVLRAASNSRIFMIQVESL